MFIIPSFGVERHRICVCFEIFNKDIIVQAYSPLNYWPHQIPPFWDAHVEAVALNYPGKTTSQVLLRWCIQMGVAVLTRSSNEERQLQNLDIFDFELNEFDMQLLSGLNTLISPYDIEWSKDIYFQLQRPQ